jgi:hypothetical protein
MGSIPQTPPPSAKCEVRNGDWGLGIGADKVGRQSEFPPRGRGPAGRLNPFSFLRAYRVSAVFLPDFICADGRSLAVKHGVDLVNKPVRGARQFSSTARFCRIYAAAKNSGGHRILCFDGRRRVARFFEPSAFVESGTREFEVVDSGGGHACGEEFWLFASGNP